MYLGRPKVGLLNISIPNFAAQIWKQDTLNNSFEEGSFFTFFLLFLNRLHE